VEQHQQHDDDERNSKKPEDDGHFHFSKVGDAFNLTGAGRTPCAALPPDAVGTCLQLCEFAKVSSASGRNARRAGQGTVRQATRAGRGQMAQSFGTTIRGKTQ
jgi:hypothetical protein